jgi:phosphohistidine swiveling domain-containing protein
MTNQRWVYFFGQGRADGGSDLKHLVGGKGASLADMTRANLKVPPGFTISAECCELFHRRGQNWPEGLLDEVRANLRRLERLVGRALGCGDNPLLVAVRSGAAQSMPGMMDTILNVGLNPECVRAMAERTGNARGAWQAYFHFLLMYVRTGLVPGKRITEDELTRIVNRFFEEEKTDEEHLDAGQFEKLCLTILLWFTRNLDAGFLTDPWDMLQGAILAVFRSWNSERAVTYRKHHKLDGLLGTAVNVQMMCASEVSGVLFTANPVNPALEQMIIESSYGLGEALVLGKVTPDRFVLAKKDLAILERNVARKDKIMATLPQDGTGQTGVRDSVSLADEQVLELARLGQRVEKHFHYPCDIEWGLAQGEFYLLQARAIKFSAGQARGGGAAKKTPATLAHASGSHTPDVDDTERETVRREEIDALRRAAEPRGTVWSRFNLAEVLPEPTPMTWSVVRRFLSGRGGVGLMYRDLGFDPDPALDEDGIFDLVCGRPYCNLSREPRMQYRNLPFEHKFDTLKANPAKASYPQATLNPARAGWRFWLFLPLVFFKVWRSSVRVRRITRTFAREFQDRIAPAFLKEVEAAWAEDLSGLSSRDVLTRLGAWIQKTLCDFARESLKPTALAGIAMGNLERALARRYQPPGVPGPQDDQPTGMHKAQAALRELVMGVKPAGEADLSGASRALAEGRLSRAGFLRRFGHRGSQEMELAQPRWNEQPEAVAALAGERVSAAHGAAAGADALAKAWDRIAAEARLLPNQRTILEAELQTVHTYLALREAGKHYLLRGYALIRRYLRELDRRYRLGGGIFFLTLDDLPRLVEGEQDDTALRQDAQALIELRRRRRQVALSLPVPQVLFSDDLEAIGRHVEVGGADVLQGVPLSAGTAEGPAWVLVETTGAPAPAEPYVLVCPSTDPAWVPLFAGACGLVMETGGVLSHGAIVAREFGLPAVAGIADVHHRLKTGQRLRLDGASGKITLLSS